MAQNKQIDSRKLYQDILSIRGKINLFTDYISYYRTILDQKSADARQQLVQKLDAPIRDAEFYLKGEEEVFASIEAVDIKAKEEKLDLEYRKMREANKRAVSKNPELADSLDAALAEKLADNDAEKVRIREETLASIRAEREAHSDVDWQAKHDALLAKKEAELAAFTSKRKESDDAKFAKNKANMEKRIAKLQAKLEALLPQMAEIQAAQQAATTLREDEILRVEDLCMYFGGLHAVDHLDFQVRKGEIYGLIGPNGAGKTTVFNCITQFYKPTDGNIIFRTREGDIIDMNKEKVHNVITLGIARTFQNIEVIPECTVLENMLIAANRQYQSTLADHFLHTKMLSLEEKVITQRAMKVLQFMGLTPYMFNFAMGLPYGILKKIEIARTLMTNPQLIILDEPAAGLNDSETKELAALIRKIREEYDCTILLVEHDMGLVMDICDRICAISFGKLLKIGTPAEIQDDPSVQQAYLGVDDEE